jgi:hypothetical protein
MSFSPSSSSSSTSGNNFPLGAPDRASPNYFETLAYYGAITRQVETLKRRQSIPEDDDDDENDSINL